MALWTKPVVDVVSGNMHAYIEACQKAAQLLHNTGVPKEEIPAKLSETVRIVLEWITR